MEFRSCPACKASVLEDDVDECPFCGASMSGKPQAATAKKSPPPKPAATRPGAKASPSAPAGKDSGKPTSPPPAGRPFTPAKSPVHNEQDDPFEVDTSALRRAVKLAPRPTKTRTLEVTCPMCETPGFMLPADAGKDVHCCNPECLVPVFKTQRPQVVAAPEEVTRDHKWLIFGGGFFALVALGVGVWFLVLAPQKVDDVVEDEVPQDVTPIEDLKLTPENKIVQRVEAPPATPAEIRAKSLAAIVDRARQRDRNRSVDYGTQLAAEAFAEAGDLTKARDQLRRLQSSAAQAPYLQVQPLVEIGWQQLAAGKLQEAQQTAVAALGKARNSPRSIRKTLDADTALAALCVATEKMDEARELIDREQDRGVRGELSTLWRAAVDSRSFQIDQEARLPWHLAMAEPMRMSVVECLTAHDQVDQALNFAATAENVASQAACGAAWAGRVTQLDAAHAIERVTAALQKSQATPAGQCQAWSAVAAMALVKKETALAKNALDNAQTAAGNLAAAVPVAVPGMKQLHGSEGKPYAGLPNPAPAQAAAQACASLAIAQLDAGDQTAAWSSFQRALDYVRSMAPSPVVTQQLLDACESQGSSLRSQLNQTLNLGGNDQSIRTEFSRYRRQCGKLHAEAQHRLNLQVSILRYAAERGLLDEVWTAAMQQAHQSNLQMQDPFLETSLPGFILSLAEAQGKSELAGNVNAAFTEKRVSIDPLDRIYAQAAAALANGNLPLASDVVERAYREQLGKKQPDRVDELALRFCAQAQAAAAPEAMLPFIKNLFDVVIQEEAFLQLAGYSMQAGTAPQLWKSTSTARDLDALDHVAVYRGYVAGFTKSTTPTQPAPATMKKPE